VNAQFCPPSEVLAFSTLGSGETDLPEVWSEPLKVVTTALEQFDSYIEVNENLPDIEIITVHSG